MALKEFKQLFSPGRIGQVEIRNRIVMNSMGTLFEGRDGKVTDRLIAYFETRAQGGVGLIATGQTRVVPQLRKDGRYTPGIWDDSFIPGWRQLAQAVHRHGAKIFMETGSDGRQGLYPGKDGKPERMAPSPVPCLYVKEIPREMTLEEIEWVIDKMAEAVVRAREAGMDGVTFESCHGYLLNQFLSASANRRTDKYGGSLENRMRFLLEMIKRSRARVGRDFPLMVRINGFEDLPDGQTLEEARVMASILVDAGIDGLDVSAGSYARMELMIPPAVMRPGFNVVSAETIKKTVPVPIIANGRINDPLFAEQILRDGRADFVGMSRASVVDPEWPKKAASGRLEDIKRCMGCGQGCLHPDGIFALKPMSCVINPTVGRERELVITPAEKSKKVLIVGGGLAGLEAGRVAAERGHDVTLIEQSQKLGGQFAVSAHGPFKQENATAIGWFALQAEKAGVKIELGKVATPEWIAQSGSDVVIVATGAKPIIPDIPGVDKPNVVSAYDILDGKAKISGSAVIIGGGLMACETADFLGERGIAVTMVARRPEIGQDWPTISKALLTARLASFGVSKITSAPVKEILDDGVLISKNGKDMEIRGVDHIVLAVGMRAANGLSEQIKDKVPEVYTIGDAKAARKASHAVAEGMEVGLQI